MKTVSQANRGGKFYDRNAEVDFWRIVLAFSIVLCHSHGLDPPDRYRYPFVGGYLSVEFFLILSGYFAAQKAASAPNAGPADAARWTARKFAGIFPYVVPVVIVHYLLFAAVDRLDLLSAVKDLVYGALEIALFPAAGLYETFYVLPLWYLSALLVVLPMFYLLLIKHWETMLAVICPLSACLIYGYFCRTIGHVDTWKVWTGLFFTSLPRAWAGLCLGGIVFLLTNKLRETAFSPAGRHILSAAEIVCGVFVLWYMYAWGYRRMDFVVIGVEALWAGMILSGSASVNGLFPSWISRCSRFCLALYTSHWTVRMLIPVWMPEADYWTRLPPYVLAAVVYAAALEACMTIVRRARPWRLVKKYLFLTGE